MIIKQEGRERRGWMGDVILLGVVIGLAFLFWRHIPSMEIIGEGAFYFVEPHFGSFDASNFLKRENFFPLREELAATILIRYLVGWFGGNVAGYMWFLLAWMLVTDGVMYFLVKRMTGSRWAAVLATAVFGLSFIGNFNMWASGGYQYFLQRGILMLPALVALTLLIAFLNGSGWRYYLLSLGVYWLTVLLGFYVTVFLPVVVAYPWSYAVLGWRRGWKTMWKWLAVPVPFVVGNYLMIRGGGTFYNANAGQAGFWSRVSVADLVSVVSQQAAVMTWSVFWEEEVWKFLKTTMRVQLTSGSRLVVAEIATILVWLVGVVVVWRWRPKWLKVTLGALVGFVGMLVANAYLTIEVYKTFTTLRYFYYPSAMFAVFWGLVLAVIFSRGKRWLSGVAVVVIVAWMGLNFYEIRREIEEIRWLHQASRDSLDLIRGMSPTLRQKPYKLFLTGPLGGYGLGFAKMFYAHPGSHFDFELPNLTKLAREKVKPEEIFVFRFDYQTRKLLDETEKYRVELARLEGRVLK